MRLTSSLLRRVGEWSKKYSNLPDSYIKRAMEQVCIIIKLFWSYCQRTAHESYGN